MNGGDAAIVGSHQAALFAYVRSLVDSPPVAADIVQETWARAIPSLRAGRVENPRAFLYRVARNLVNDRARDSGKWRPWLADEEAGITVADESPDAERQVFAADRLRMVRELVEDLPPRCREIFTLRKFDGLDQAVIADRLGITRGAVEKQLRIALLTLATRLGEIEGEA
ncbi:RNA polymerase sigma-70 factor (ECF subfamily) [Novosphingobium sp. PhB165]|uniref:RNA polymerase sigma factor n=1 Tax=Novosphingobium sp. PhB165 TaxID=2485105 RepID=UPI0010453BD5|nr:sigma-70 family RNA polymerase sigma factor [Novosphingobium sp. PhB165]TCM16503.1 RNA polymerase sigma-70 factor (ECF subfamily) [Novosphingobium sp. PhB165]